MAEDKKEENSAMEEGKKEEQSTISTENSAPMVETATTSQAKKDEEITFDISKIAALFGKKKAETSKEIGTSEKAKDGPSNEKTITEEKKEIAKREEVVSEPIQKEEKKDDDIVIDFSKLKNLFSSKEKNPEEKKEGKGKEEVKNPSDDEITIDLSSIGKKLKGAFKDDGKTPQKSGDEVNVDWGRVTDFFRTYGVFLLMLIPIILSIHVRMQAADLAITDNWAQESVINSIRAQIEGQIASQYPNLPAQNRNALVDAEVQKYLTANWGQISEQIGQVSNYYRSHFQDDSGIPYMPDIDTYYWMRYAQNILDHGYPGTSIKDRLPYDDYQLAPDGRFVTDDTLPSYFGAYWHSFLTLFSPDLTLVQTFSYYPVIITAFSTLLIFLIARKISNALGGLFAASMFAVNTAFLGRSLYGHADNDAWVLFFPLLITYLFFEMLDRSKMWQVLGLGAIAGILVGIYTFAWGGGWWFIFDLILGMAGISFVYILIRDLFIEKKTFAQIVSDRDIRRIVFGGAIFFFASMISVILATDVAGFTNGLLGPLTFSNIKTPVTPSLWPNVLTTVAELNPGDLNSAMGSVGGKYMFYFGILGILLALLKRDTKGRWDIRFAILLALWFAATSFATIKGIRFTLLLAPAFAVAFGVAVGMLYAILSKWLSRELHIHKAVSATLLVLLFSLLLIAPIKSSYAVAKNDLPIINDVWWNSLSAIKERSEPNAIITSWWDFGHHFKYIADRPVTFDGTTQTSTPARWVGKFFMVSDEEEAESILRLLDCSGGGKAYNELNKKFNDPFTSVKIVDEIISLSKEDANALLLKRGLSSEEANRITEMTHCTPNQGIVIASNDMIGKSGVWAHFGSWDFEKADIWYNARPKSHEDAVNYMIQKYNYSQQKAESVAYEVKAISTNEEGNRWIAPWPGYGGETSCGRNGEEKVYFCDNGLIFNYTSKDVYAIQQGKIVRPRMIGITTRDGIELRSNSGAALDFGFTLIPEDQERFTGITSSVELTGGMFTRMFYMNGHGLRYFTPFYSERGIIGTDVKVYSTNWTRGEPYIYTKYMGIIDALEGVEMETPSISLEAEKEGESIALSVSNSSDQENLSS